MILITGATSGIGKACAEEFAGAGKHLFLVARRKERLDGLAEELRAKSGTTVEVAQLDVSRRAAVERFFDTHSNALSRVSVLINNAGLAKGMDHIHDGKIEDWEEMIDTNIKGLLYLTRGLVPGMKARGDGHIINLGSVAGRWVYPKGNVYCATKFAVRALTEGLRMDLLGTGIRVTEIAPGMVETEFSEVRLGDTERAKAVYAGMTPLTAKDIAEAVAWCVSRPKRINIQEMVIYPTEQASPTLVSRRT